jgi:predicted dehydrogenase
LVEKPIASSVEEGNEIVNAARRAGVTLMVGHVERFNPAVEAIKQAIRARIFFRSPSRGWDRSRRACRMSAWSSISPCTTSI